MIIGFVGYLLFCMMIALSPFAYLARFNYDMKLVYLIGFGFCGLCYGIDGQVMLIAVSNLINSILTLPWVGGL